MQKPLEIDLADDRTIVIRRGFAAPRDLVFACWTKPPLVRRWLTGPDGWEFETCDIDLRVGGKYRYVWRNFDGTVLAMSGTYREITPPERLVSTEEFDEDWTGGETHSTVEFVADGGKTMTVNTIVYASKEGRDGALKTGMDVGMEASYRRLDSILPALGAKRHIRWNWRRQ